MIIIECLLQGLSYRMLCRCRQKLIKYAYVVVNKIAPEIALFTETYMAKTSYSRFRREYPGVQYIS